MFHRILVPIDVAQESSWRRALPQAIELARVGNGEIAALTVVPDLQALFAGAYQTASLERLMDLARQRLNGILEQAAPAPSPIRPVVRQGSIYGEILAEAREFGADLIVMESHRPEMMDYLIGPNAAQVVRHAECSVLVLRSRFSKP